VSWATGGLPLAQTRQLRLKVGDGLVFSGELGPQALHLGAERGALGLQGRALGL
jgi:hypothetical protein